MRELNTNEQTQVSGSVGSALIIGATVYISSGGAARDAKRAFIAYGKWVQNNFGKSN